MLLLILVLFDAVPQFAKRGGSPAVRGLAPPWAMEKGSEQLSGKKGFGFKPLRENI